jgi:hypothetical protein
VSSGSWQTELSAAVEDVARKLEDVKALVGERPDVKADYEKAVDSVRTARVDVNHFIGFWDKAKGFR